ncbi:MAG TPA: TIM barrel protein [Bacteroidota bacterium]|nr:TIM barrel protein [Bacteroidota bacterium]
MDGYPRINLALDNCFASKRWTRPDEWMEVTRELGVRYIEASADTEADPLYCGEEYMADWTAAVRKAEERTGAKVANLYSGHGTYSTLGLGHTDGRVRARIRESWVKPILRTAAQLNAGLGFYCHAFPASVLQDPAAYAEKTDELTGELAEIARYARELGDLTMSLEQMYSPHQVPWTIRGTHALLAEVHRRSAAPLYVTIDTGHQTGQNSYVRPSESSIEKMLMGSGVRRRRAGPGTSGDTLGGVWLGPDAAFTLAESAGLKGKEAAREARRSLATMMDQFPFLFSRPEDSDTYQWLRSLGCYSPIVHLQQVVGKHSAHLPFTMEANRKGTIQAPRLLGALADSYAQAPAADLPPRVDVIYLTLEIFSGTSQPPRQILANLRESVAYWRRFVPRDGLRLDELVENHRVGHPDEHAARIV